MLFEEPFLLHSFLVLYRGFESPTVYE
jgi:hypothetical protein